jgi:hypothetical protein
MTEKDRQNRPTGTQREFREYARGQLNVEHLDVHPIAGLGIPEDKRQALMFAADVYEPPKHPDGSKVEGFPRDFWNTSFARRAVKKHTTDAATEAVEKDNVSQLATMVGDPSHQNDISGLKTTNKLVDWLINTEQCKVIYCAATMGRGKTDWSLLLLELIEHQYRQAKQMQDSDNIPTPEFATNFKVETPDHIDAQIQEFHNYDNFLEWAEDGSSDDVRWFIFDEASTELTAQSGANAQKVAEVFAPFVRKMRKSGINMITIGHDKSDVHPAIRAVASYIHKPDVKVAKIYEGVKNREPYGHYLTLDGVPPTSWSYNTDDVAEWDWGSQVDDGPDVEELDNSDKHISKEEWIKQRNDWMASMHEAGLSYADVGQVFDLSGEGARKAIKRFDPEEFSGRPEELSDEVAVAELVAKYVGDSEIAPDDVKVDHFPEAPADD